MRDKADRWPKTCLNHNESLLCMEPYGHYGDHEDRDGNKWPSTTTHHEGEPP